MKRVVERLRQIGPRPSLLSRYVVHHVGMRTKRRALRRSYSRVVATPPEGARLRAPAIELQDGDALPHALRPAAERIRLEADAAARHEVDLLGSGPTRLEQLIDWHRDFKSGYRWPVAFYQDVEVTRLDDGSDAKVPWELSRGHHLVTLARASALWDEERYATELEDQLEHWLEANPPGFGINWTNPMEIAIRAVNWVWAVGTVEQRRPIRPDLRAEITRSLQVHGRHIASNLEGSPWLRSNHYLADVLGLVVLGACLEGDPAARRWLEMGRAALEREIGAQVHPDGLAFEASLPYHALVLEMFILAHHVCHLAGTPLSSAFDDRLTAMLVAVRSLRHPDGRLPQLGDGDSGRILPAGVARPPTADHLLALGAAELGVSAFLRGDPHEEVAWILGLPAWRRVAGESRSGTRSERDVRRNFPHGGVFVLDDGHVHTVVRCGDVGQNGNGGHAHNDALSFELSLDGELLLADSGTYVYTSDVRARNEFRGTAAHNTVVVDGEEINPIDPAKPFELRQASTPRVLAMEPGRLVLEHDGYRRLACPTVHRRTFTLRPKGLAIEDELLGSGFQNAEAYLHFASGAAVTGMDGGLCFHVVRGDVEATVRFTGVDSVSLETGWVSASFGSRERAPLVRAVVSGELPKRFGVELDQRSRVGE